MSQLATLQAATENVHHAIETLATAAEQLASIALNSVALDLKDVTAGTLTDAIRYLGDVKQTWTPKEEQPHAR